MNYGKTKIILCKDEKDLGGQAAAAVAGKMRELLKQRNEIRMILAAGESQNTFLDALAREPEVAWGRVVCFNMDDYWDVRIPERYTCGYQTRTELYDKVRRKQYLLVRFNDTVPYPEARRYVSLLRADIPLYILYYG